MTETTLPGRSARKRQTILTAGQQLFLSNGYQGTSMDQVAATAAVSKQTVYKHFGEKRELLFAIVTDALDSAAGSVREHILALADSTDLDADLTTLAGDYLRVVMQEPVVQLRRLVIGEANRLPELARLYYEHAPLRTLGLLADAITALHDRGLLNAPEPSLAAEHFAFLIVGRPIDQALFDGAPAVLARVDVDSYARAGVDVFLAAYRSR
ncbi:MAG: TetR/AcrR family transcriptional regulator, mexJK operon transcriptional repressor [Mycobacterium sp.]|jgi:TetR/AcrR family transcriptional repressor of mexJK operon|nr:TetR/AcrR family transcriptional regulator, mexJK operon transcriptional repressor [Mycobacterium sp.]